MLCKPKATVNGKNFRFFRLNAYCGEAEQLGKPDLSPDGLLPFGTHKGKSYEHFLDTLRVDVRCGLADDLSIQDFIVFEDGWMMQCRRSQAQRTTALFITLENPIQFFVK